MYALVGSAALALLGVGIAHEVEKPQPGWLLILGFVCVFLGCAFLLFAWATSSVGVRDDRVVQYYFGRSFRSVRFDEVESAEVQPWGLRFRGFVIGRGPYVSLALRKKNGWLVGFDGLRSADEPAFRHIAEEYSKKEENSFRSEVRRNGSADGGR